MRPLILALLVAGCAPALHGAASQRTFDVAERSAWIVATRWGLDRAPDARADRVVLGSRVLYLAFPAPPAATARALLVLTPLAGSQATLVVERIADGGEIARVAADARHPAWIEVPIGGPVEIAIRADRPIAIATPSHVEPRLRPRIELSVSTAGAR